MGRSAFPVRAVARVLIQNAAGELLLCRSRNGKAWVPPGGTVDPGESLATAAAREAEEEAGLSVTLGRMIYLQEFRPASGEELVLETAFLAAALREQPAPELAAARGIEPAGGPDRPWAAWFIQDVDGPRREVRWFSREALGVVPEPVYPTFLKESFWEVDPASPDPYLGAVQAK